MQQPNPRKAFYFQWHFIQNCNLRCTHCYQNDYSFSDLPEEKIFQIANVLDFTLAKWKRLGRISLTGGEPFLRKDLLFELLNFFQHSDNFYWIGILTNGTLVDNNIVAELQAFSKLKEIQVSIDGSSEQVHDAIRGNRSFKKSLVGLDNLKGSGINRSIMFTLHKMNKDDVINVIDKAVELEIDALTIERVTPMNQDDINNLYINPEELKDIYTKIYQKKLQIERNSKLKIRVSRPLWAMIDDSIGGYCPAGVSSLAVLHDGTVLPCRRMEIPLGNILDDGLFKIWYKSDVLWKLRNKDLLSQKCRQCEFLANCGGCRAIAHTVNKDFLSEDPQCWKKEK